MTRVNLPKSGTADRVLLAIDSAINFALGGLLLTYPEPLVKLLGLPAAETSFFPRILGGVLIGIGAALLVEHRRGEGGLGLDGAVAINLCGAGVLAAWLAVRPGDFSFTGRVTLWGIAVLVLGIGLLELLHRKAN